MTSINVTSTHIYFGSSYYDISRSGSAVQANITKFNENKNATFHVTNTNIFPSTMKIKGHIAQVRLDGIYYPLGTNWSYSGGTNVTTINVNSHQDIFVSWNGGTVTTHGLFLSGSIFGATAYFNPLKIFVSNPPLTNVTEIGLFNQDGLLYDKIFSPPLSVASGSNFTIPYKFNDTNTGVETYTAEAIVQSGSNDTIVQSNQITFYFGSFTPGNLSLNYTNPLSAPFIFKRTTINSSSSTLDILYPASFNSSCNLSYKFALTNQTYNNLPTSHATFQFIGQDNEVVNVSCMNHNGNETGKYILTQSQSSFPLIQQIKDMRSGEAHIGTLGQFGAFDLVTMLVLILSIIGFNRVNESVGVVFNVALIGACAYFGIIEWPVILSSSVALVLVLIISSTRKTQGF